MRSIGDWNFEYLKEVADPSFDETLRFERKGSAKLDLTTPERKQETHLEIARQVCAFANASGGFIVFGIKAGGGLDSGVPATVSKGPIKEWVEALIRQQHQPRIVGCEAKFIRDDSHHAPQFGALVIEAPLSESRPHAVVDGAKEIPYLRVGEHSAPMSLQTYRDLVARAASMSAEIEDLTAPPPHGGESEKCVPLSPTIRLVAGRICNHWAFELRAEHPKGHIHFRKNTGSKAMVFGSSLYMEGQSPLLLHRTTRVDPVGFDLVIPKAVTDWKNIRLTASLFIESGVPALPWTFRLTDIMPSNK